MDDLQGKYKGPGVVAADALHKRLGVKSIRSELENTPKSNRTHLEQNLNEKLKKRIISILKDRHNIDVMEGKVKKGGFSYVIDIGEGQVLHISLQTGAKKPHIRYDEPEILQPLAVLEEGTGLKIEVLPKVGTEGVTKEHINSLIASLAKKDLLFADCTKLNVGLIKVKGKDIPVVIGDGSVIRLDNNGIQLEESDYDFPKSNLQHFSDTLKDSFQNEGKIVDVNPKISLQYFKDNKDYKHYPWVDVATGKWAQEQYIEDNGLEKGKIKGIIAHEALEGIRKRDLSPLAKEFVDLLVDHSLREKDAQAVAADTIHENWGDKVPGKETFQKYVKAARDNAARGI